MLIELYVSGWLRLDCRVVTLLGTSFVASV